MGSSNRDPPGDHRFPGWDRHRHLALCAPRPAGDLRQWGGERAADRGGQPGPAPMPSRTAPSSAREVEGDEELVGAMRGVGATASTTPAPAAVAGRGTVTPVGASGDVGRGAGSGTETSLPSRSHTERERRRRPVAVVAGLVLSFAVLSPVRHVVVQRARPASGSAAMGRHRRLRDRRPRLARPARRESPRIPLREAQPWPAGDQRRRLRLGAEPGTGIRPVCRSRSGRHHGGRCHPSHRLVGRHLDGGLLRRGRRPVAHLRHPRPAAWPGGCPHGEPGPAPSAA